MRHEIERLEKEIGLNSESEGDEAEGEEEEEKSEDVQKPQSKTVGEAANAFNATRKTVLNKINRSNDTTTEPPSKRSKDDSQNSKTLPVIKVDEDAPAVYLTKKKNSLSRKRYYFGGDYYLQVGDVDFGGLGGGTMEAIIIGRPDRLNGKSFKFSLPSKYIFTMMESLQTIIVESNIKETDL